MKKTHFLLLCAILLMSTAFAQQQLDFEVSTTKAALLGKTKTVRSIVELSDIYKHKQKAFRMARQKPEDFKYRRGTSKVVRPELEHQGIDQIRQAEDGDLLVFPTVNIFGQDFGGSPSDPSGDVGLEYYIQIINVTLVGVYDKQGNLVTSFPAARLWDGLGVSSFGDPIILFDERAERWFITEFTGPSNMLVAVSETSDPLGSYFAYSFSAPEFPDYPKYGLWPEALVVTTNEEGPGRLHQYFIDRLALLDGADEVSIQRVEIRGNTNTEAGFFVTTPIDLDGKLEPSNINPIVMILNDSSWGDSEQDQLELYEFDINWDNPDSTIVSNLSLPTTPFDGYPCEMASFFTFECMAQPSDVGLDGIPEVIMNVPKYRNFGTHESIVLAFITDVTDGTDLSGIRWMELRKSGDSDWSIYQEGTYAPDDNLNRFMPSIAMDSLGNIAMGYNVSNSETFAGVRFTGRYSTDSLGIMSVREYNVADGVANIEAGGRFGDYSQMSLDPVDESTFWFTTEYAGDEELATKTRIVSFKMTRNANDIGVASVVGPAPGALTANESIAVEVGNVGLDAIADFELTLLVNGTAVQSVNITDTIAPNGIYDFTFENLDFSVKGEYDVAVVSSHPLDLEATNNSSSSLIRSIFNYDTALSATADANACGTANVAQITLTNDGAVTVETLAIEIVLNELPVDTFTWEGNLELDETVSISVPFDLVEMGDNQIDFNVLSINGITDEQSSNNSSSVEMNFDEGLSGVQVQILTDFFPEETSWRLIEIPGRTIATGGDYDSPSTLYIESFCLNPDRCYIFTIFDSFGDGICCGENGNGNYQIINEDGSILAESNGRFDASQSKQICPKIACTLSAAITVSDSDDNNNGSIIIEANGSSESYQYSIDGGETFQSSSTFENLAPGDYTVVVVEGSNSDCTYEEVVTVNLITSLQSFEADGFKLLLSPNPNDGYFNIQIEDDSKALQLAFDILDANGRIIQRRTLSRYDGIFNGRISLLAHPKGVYYIRLKDKYEGRLFKVLVL